MERDRLADIYQLINDETLLYSFLSGVKGKSKLQTPTYLTNDIKAGICYIFSTLNDQVFFALYLLYADKKSEAEVCNALNMSLEQLTNYKSEGKRKFQAKWEYVQHGIEGLLKKKSNEAYKKGYIQGHNNGYRQSIQDTENKNPPSYISDELLSLPLESLSLSTHARNCLIRYNYTRIGDFSALSEEKILRMRNMGKITANEIAHALNRIGVKNTEWDYFLL